VVFSAVSGHQERQASGLRIGCTVVGKWPANGPVSVGNRRREPSGM